MAFYLGAIWRKSLEVYSAMEISPEDASRLYFMDPETLQRELETLDGIFEPPCHFENRVAEARMRTELGDEAIMDFSKQMERRDDSFIVLSPIQPEELPREVLKRGKEIAKYKHPAAMILDLAEK